MSFPWQHYEHISIEAAAIIRERDSRGRNEEVDFYDGFPHGYRDASFELWRRVARILGAEKTSNLDVARADALDLLNYAAFYVMLLDRWLEEMKPVEKPPRAVGGPQAERYYQPTVDMMRGEGYAENRSNTQPTAVGCEGAD